MLAKGVNASPGAAVGQIYFDADTAEKMAKEHKQDVIMVRPFTKPDDVHGMIASKGILTSEGGATSHAAVVARQFGIPAVVGASALKIDMEQPPDDHRRTTDQGRRVDVRGRRNGRSLTWARLPPARPRSKSRPTC